MKLFFIIVGIVLILVTLILIRRLILLSRKTCIVDHSIPLASESLKNQKGIVTKRIDPSSINPGAVKVNGDLWNAITLSDESIDVGSTVIINSVTGIRLNVSVYKE